MCRPGGHLINKKKCRRKLPHKPRRTEPASTSAASSPTEEFGYTALPLNGLVADIKILDVAAKVNLRQHFRNPLENPIEAVYRLPLDGKASVCEFYAVVDGRKIVAECKKKEDALNTYDDAVSSGHGAYLAEQETKDALKISVGNLPPGKEAEVCVSYIVELEQFNDELQFVLPTAKDKYPAYKDSTATTTPININISMAMTSEIAQVTCESHETKVEIEGDKKKGTVTYSSDSAKPVNKDLVVNIKLDKPNLPCAQLQKNDKDEVAAMLSVFPPLLQEEPETEVVFLIDRSGSMMGDRIASVRSTMQIFLRSLTENIWFNIIGFGSSFELLFPESVPYNDLNLGRASAHITNLSANLGGTELQPPLQNILGRKPPKKGLPRQVFVLTDGAVSNTAACIKTVKDNAKGTRVFTFGIGSGASVPLVKGLAEAGNGHSEFIVEGQPMESKVLKQLKLAIQPVLNEITVKWTDLKAIQAPFRIDPVFTGGRLTFYAFLAPDQRGKGKIVVKGMIGSKSYEAAVEVNTDDAVPGDFIHKLAARALINDLNANRSYAHSALGVLMPKKPFEDVSAEIVRLSTTYNVLSSLTAFVAVEEREEATEGTMEKHQVGIEVEGSKFGVKPKVEEELAVSPHLRGKKNTKAPKRSGRRKGKKLVLDKDKKTANVFQCKVARDECDQRARYCSAAPQSQIQTNSNSSSSISNSLSLFKRVSKDSAKKENEKEKVREEKEEERKCKKEDKKPEKKMKKKKKKSKKVAPEKLRMASSGSEDEEDEAGVASASGGSDDELGGSAEKLELNNEISLDAGIPESDSAAIEFDEAEVEFDDEEDEDSKPASNKKTDDKPPPAEMKSVIIVQKANGSWALSEVIKALQSGAKGKALTEKVITDSIPSTSSSSVTNAELIWTTAVIIAYLELVFADQQVNWDLVVTKAKKWVNKELGSSASDWLKSASQLVKSKCNV